MAEAVRERPKSRKKTKATEKKRPVTLPQVVKEDVQEESNKPYEPTAHTSEPPASAGPSQQPVESRVSTEERSHSSKTELIPPETAGKTSKVTDQVPQDSSLEEQPAESPDYSEHDSSESISSSVIEVVKLDGGQDVTTREAKHYGETQEEEVELPAENKEDVEHKDLSELADAVAESHEPQQQVEESPTVASPTEDETVRVTVEHLHLDEEKGASATKTGTAAASTVASEESTTVKLRLPRVAHRKLYPTLEGMAAPPQSEETLRPLTEEQLKTLYYNAELESLSEFTEKFIKHMNKDKHEFYELVLNYYRARHHLVSAEHDVNSLREDAEQHLDRVWITRERTMLVQGKCADQAKVSVQHKFDQVTFSEEAWNELSRTLKDIRTHIHDEMSLHAYASQLSRLQVESYIYDFYTRSPGLSELSKNLPCRSWLPQERDVSLNTEVAGLRDCIAVLFMFQRKSAKDNVFVNDTRHWISRLVATLLRVATLEDHLWLLQHVLRCPPGVGSWAADLIQVAPPPPCAGRPSWGSPHLDHCLAVLALLMAPIKGREEALYQLKAAVTPSQESVDHPWIMVDSDGEEDEDTSESWHYLHENDLVKLFQQFPMNDIFKHVLFIEKDQSGNLQYDQCRTSESSLLKLFALASCMIAILGQGLHNFTLSRYRQFNKRIAKSIKQVTGFISDHWQNYKIMLSTLSPATEERLQLEYDQVFYRATRAILSAQRLGSWQFMADMPYSCVSWTMMWKLVWLMHQGWKDKVVELDQSITLEQCIADLDDETLRQQFEERLLSMPTSEAIYLLTTFANMAASRLQADCVFIEAIASEIYQIAYLSAHTRDFCSATGRELLANIARHHPYVISILLDHVKITVDKVGMVSLYLFRELPLSLWRPLERDYQVLRTWLLDEALSTPVHQLACHIYTNLNWGLQPSGTDLFLPLAVHRQTAILLVEVTTRHLTNKHMTSFITDSVRQVASVVRSSIPPEQALCSWLWEVALKLQLHAHQQPNQVAASPTSGFVQGFDAPDLGDNPKLHPLLKAVKDKSALASYLALVMTKYGHTTSGVCGEGLMLLSTLVEQGHYTPAVRALNLTMPLFYHCPQYLTSSPKFIQTLQLLVTADSQKRGILSSEFPGLVTQLFTAMTQHQVNREHLPPCPGGSVVVLFWLQILTNVNRWNQDRNILYVIDNLIAAAFVTQQGRDVVSQFFSNINKQLVRGQREQGVLSSIVSWMAAGHNQPSLLEANASAEFPWFAWSVLLAERQMELESFFWAGIQRELFTNPSLPLEQALKRAANQAKLELTIAPHRLCLYRWAHQALETPFGHPVLPLLWQQFFLCYLGRLTQEHELPQRGSVGERFFESSANNSFMKQMKKRLNEAADFHHKAAAATSTADSVEVAGVLSPTNENADDSLVLVEGRQDTEQRVFHENLVRLYQTMTFWLDEPRLHDPQLYLPALPSQYDAERLLLLFNSNQTPWLEFFCDRHVSEKLGIMSAEWVAHIQQSPDPTLLTSASQETPTSRILARLKPTARPQEPPPQMVIRAPVPAVHPRVLTDKQAMLYALRSDLHSICDYARFFTQHVAKNVALDCNFIDLLPSLYRNEPTEIVLSAACTSTFNPTHRCKGPASLPVQYKAKKRAELVSRKVEENRVEYKQLMIESLLPPAENICSAVVHVENAISALIRLSQANKNQESKEAALTQEVGSSLFYYLATLITEETKYYPPTRQFFAACIEVLGQEFIRNHPCQSQPLMQAILQTPSLAELLSPNFSPNASPDLFITMYEDIIPVPVNQEPAVAFTLLTKFDVEAWLTRSKPSLSQRAALVQVISSALCSCGQEPDCTMAVVFEVYRSHLMQVFTHKFPDHYGDVLRLVVNGSKAGELSPKVWGDFLSMLGCAVVPEVSPPGDDIEVISLSETKTVTSPTSPPPRPQLNLSAKNMRETLEWLSSHYFTARVSSPEVASFGLYPRWKSYIPYIATFLGHLATCTITQMATVCKNGDIAPQQAVLDLWKQIMDAFAPWIQPLDNNGQVLSPWLDSDIVMATTMVGTFVHVVRTLYEQFEGLLSVGRQDALRLMWPYYVDALSLPGTPEHVLQVLHCQLRSLPWSHFYPDAQAMALMLQLKERHSRSCFLFAGHVMTSVRWAHILEFVGNHEALSRLHATLFQLLIYMARESDLLANTQLIDLLQEAEGYNWSFLDAVSYSTAVSWFLDNCDTRCVVAERSSKQAVVLRLLRSAAGFTHESDMPHHPETPVKRVTFVRSYVKLMCRCSHLPDLPSDTYALLTTNLLTEVEAVIGTNTDPSSQHQEALTLCSEVLATLNHLNPSGRSSDMVLTAMLQWLASSGTSLLLLPIVSAAGRTLASLGHMVQIVEASVDAHFNSGVSMEDACGWGWVLAAVQVPELAVEDFIAAGVEHGSYLTLFAHVLQQLPLCQSPQNEFMMLRGIITWTTKARPRQENEAKLLLWWGKVLELTLRQVSFNADQQTLLETLLAFTPALATLGEDKSSSGLWGAIGLGKKSPLSHRFRLLVRSLLVFLLAQMPNKAALRLTPGAPGAVRGDTGTPPVSPSQRSSGSCSPRGHSPSPQATAALSQLESLKTNKHYAAFTEHIDWAVNYTSNPNHCLQDAPNVLVHLATQLFPETVYLGLLRPQLG